MIISKPDQEFLNLYLKSYASISLAENIVICDNKGYILFAANNFIKTLSKEPSLIVGTKLDNLDLSKNNLQIEKTPIISPITGYTLAIKYKFNKTDDLSLYTKMQQKRPNKQNQQLSQQKSSQLELNKLELQKKLAYLGYDKADLGCLTLYILGYHNVFCDSETKQVKISDLKGQLLYKTPNLSYKNYVDSAKTWLGVDKLISPLSGKSLATVTFFSKNEH